MKINVAMLKMKTKLRRLSALVMRASMMTKSKLMPSWTAYTMAC